MYHIIADTHTHTIASAHAYSTITENARYAASVGMQYLGWTDHAPGLGEDGAHPWHFGNMRVVPDFVEGVRILRGVEVNILDLNGAVDRTVPELAQMNWVNASIHWPLKPDAPGTDCTSAYLALAENPYVDVFSHSGSPDHPYDYARAIPIFRECGKIVEINEHSFRERKRNIPNCIEIARLCKKHECRIVVASDAHYATLIGHFPNALQMLEEIDFPEKLLLNADADRFAAYLEEREKRVGAAK